jgi:lipid-A-disaccharide synthase
MKIFVSAAEISSDIHAAKILKSIADQLYLQGQTVQWCGIGGPQVRALSGFKAIEKAENMRAMGFVEIVGKYSFFKKLLNRAADEIASFQPDLILTFDYPDFHFRLLQKVVEGNLAPQALRVCGIPPKVWVWRSKRVEKIRALYHGVWVIFPFEQKFYQSRSIPVIHEGNPLLENLPIQPSDALSKKTLETITVMPGSREGELKSHLPVIPETLRLFSEKIGKPILAQVPVPAGVETAFLQSHLSNTDRVTYRFMPGASAQSLAETRIGLIKSGTSTLESVVLGCIPVIFYRMSPISEMILRVMIVWLGGYLGPVGLPNILLGIKKREDSPFPELLGPEAKPEAMASALARIHNDLQLQQRLGRQCEQVKDLFQLNQSKTTAADRTAIRILQWIKHPPKASVELKTKVQMHIAFISFLWSLVNFIRRRLSLVGLLPIHWVKTPSILIGNLQAGGAGKTPLVIEIAKEAVARGMKTAVISRGYGATDENPLGDEPLEISQAVPGVFLFVNPDRVQAIQQAEMQNCDLLIFDDGFQNLKFKTRTTLIAVTDRSRNEVVYRDFDGEAQFADWIIGTKGLQFRDPFTRFADRFFKIEWDWIEPFQEPVWLYCGIADPAELVSFYRDRGLIIERIIAVQDHGSLSQREVKNLMLQALEAGCVLAMTPKDAVKFPGLEGNLRVLKRRIRNRDWIDAIFKSKL